MIVLRGITKRFGKFTAVKNVDLAVGKGTVYGLLGANGAGKTTLIKMLCGLLVPTSGHGEVLGRDLVSGRAYIKQRIGYMSQKFSLYDDLTVRENLSFYSQLYNVANREERIATLLRQFDISHVQEKVVYSLSSGIRQRVAFACAIVHEPQLLFLDEPTSGVDPIARRVMWDWLYELAASGMTIVVTTHYMDEAEHCDRVAFMNAGEIVAEGTVSALRQQFADADSDGQALPSLEDVFVRACRRERVT
ncbi:ABC transporter ATP-binding protein [Numidum massiliense]|uniref:ABC transporter ATP-binding protein n=1 Tax=Numidum massiliense TaxID=1522315 RepID=UPI001E58751E|nr:ABC transporter ATP-binding protein [Numidum massiliense]